MGQITTYGTGEGKSAEQLRAEAERLREFGPKPKPRVIPGPTAEELAERQADMDRLADLMLEREKNAGTFYRGLKMMVSPIWKDQANSLEAGKICARLGIPSPYTTTAMGLGEGAGVPQDRLHLFDLLCDKLKRKFRGAGRISREDFESP